PADRSRKIVDADQLFFVETGGSGRPVQRGVEGRGAELFDEGGIAFEADRRDVQVRDLEGCTQLANELSNPSGAGRKCVARWQVGDQQQPRPPVVVELERAMAPRREGARPSRAKRGAVRPHQWARSLGAVAAVLVVDDRAPRLVDNGET